MTNIINIIKLVLHENIPCWYEISWQETPPALILKIHKEFIDSTEHDFTQAPIIKHFKSELNLPEFEDDFNKNIGFGGIFKYKGEKDNFIEFLIEVPQVKKYPGTKCKECGGTGWNEERDMRCFYCEGGKKWTMDWKDATKISATFTVLTSWLMYPQINTSCFYYQMMTVQTITQNNIHGGSLSGDCSIPFKIWCESKGRVELPEVIDAMKAAYRKMVGLREFSEYSINAWIDNGKFILNCPGDACGLHPSDWHSCKEEGFEFSCHNVDSSIQQITLLAGLACLCDTIKKG